MEGSVIDQAASFVVDDEGEDGPFKSQGKLGKRGKGL